MKRRTKLTAVILMFALALCLLPVQALALSGETEAPELDPAAEAEESAETEVSLEEAVTYIHIGPEDELYTVETDVVFNNGGTVYNNGGTVYNNAGLVYNNAGTVYNNAGTVYANGGVVYNNDGLVFNNGAVLYDNSGLASAPAVPDYDRVSFAEDYSAFAQFEGLAETDAGGALLAKGASCVIRPKEGFSILTAETTSGIVEPGEDGAYVLSDLEEDAEVALTFKTGAPHFSVMPGTYSEGLYLELTVPEGVDVYFTDDGSEPQVGQGRYTGPIAIQKGAKIKAIAAAEGAEVSDLIEAAYAIVRVEGPEFEPVAPNYVPETRPIVVTNDSPVDARVLSVALAGEDADRFILSHSSGRKIAAGDVMAQYWTVQPNGKLPVGTYTALIIVTLDGGEEVILDLSFTVAGPGSAEEPAEAEELAEPAEPTEDGKSKS